MPENIPKPPSPDSPVELGWTLGQRRALTFLLAIFLAVLWGRFACNRRYVADPQPLTADRADELATRVDPNSADWETLAAIPTLGEKRAREIVAYREKNRVPGRDTVVFHELDDLMRVRGIGRATAENLKPYLVFPPPGP